MQNRRFLRRERTKKEKEMTRRADFEEERLEALERYTALDEIVEEEVPFTERIDE